MAEKGDIMYRIPKNFKDFDINAYYDSPSGVYGLIHQDWPLFRSDVKKHQLIILMAGIEKSLSLDVAEKLRIFNTKLVAFQVRSLLEVFSEEETEFKKLTVTEGHKIFELAVNASTQWIECLLPQLLTGPLKSEEEKQMELLDAMMLKAEAEEAGTPEFL